MARTDIHRPSVINPAEYDFVAVKYIGGSKEGHMDTLGAAQFIAEHIRSTGGRYSTHEHGGTCHVCGAMAMYLAVWHHVPTNTYICTGEDCAEKMELHGANFQTVRAEVKRLKNHATGKARAEQALADRNLSDAWALYTTNVRDDFQYEERTIADMVSKLVQYGSLSLAQWNFMIRLFDQINNRAAKEAERAANAAKSNYVGTIGERITIEGTIFFTTDYETAYGTTYVTGIKDAAGNIFIQKGVAIGRKGEEITLKATIKDHSEREGVKQTIISRPKVM